jgi:CheY-like chemotaxis protein/ribosomal protein S27AE
MPADVYTIWTERGLSCRLSRGAGGWEVSVETDGNAPFLRRFAHSRGDAGNQAEYLRVLLDRSRAGVRKPRERQPLVLIVEDDAENLFAYEETLKLESFRTAPAPTIDEARRVLREISPSAVLLDHMLPDGDGAAFARELRSSSADAAIPIVLLTGLDPARVSRDYGGGPDALLRKPCRPETLTAVLKLLVQRTGPRTLARPAPDHAHAGALTRARCPVCGIAGALADHTGRFHCQQCGKEGRMERDRSVGPES